MKILNQHFDFHFAVPPRICDKPLILDYDNKSLKLSWSPVIVPRGIGASPVRYIIEVREPPYQNWKELAKGLTDTSFKVWNLDPEKDYMYRVIPVNEFGPGEPSMPVATYMYRKKCKYSSN